MDDKKSVLDIHARSANGTWINIEIQLANRHDKERRTLFYWSRIYSGQLNEGMGYKELAKTITINILNFPFIKPTERYHTTFHLYEDEEDFMLTDVMEIHFMEIPKLMVNWRRKALIDEAAAVREAELREQEAGEKGMLQGALKAAESIARSLLLSGMDVNTVAQHTGLSKETVSAIQQSLR